MDKLRETLISHEGSNKYVYTDSLGYSTIAVGRCVDFHCHHGLSDDEIAYLLQNDINSFQKQLMNKDFYSSQSEVRKEVLIELVFNMGMEHLEGFENFLAAMLGEDYPKAVNELKDSLWANQVHEERVNNICYRLLNDAYP